MTSDQIKAVGRVAGGFVGGVLVAKGLLNGEQLNAVLQSFPSIVDALGVLLSAGAAIWGAWRASPQQQLLTVAARKDIDVIGADELTALNTPSPKVIPTTSVRFSQ
jgi:hypothetical protein